MSSHLRNGRIARQMRRALVIVAWFVLLIAVSEIGNTTYSFFYEQYLTPVEKAHEVPSWYYLVLAGFDLTVFVLAALFLGYLIKSSYPALLAALGLAQAYLLVGFLFGGIWRFSTSHPSALEALISLASFFVPTMGAVVGSLLSKWIRRQKRAETST